MLAELTLELYRKIFYSIESSKNDFVKKDEGLEMKKKKLQEESNRLEDLKISLSEKRNQKEVELKKL